MDAMITNLLLGIIALFMGFGLRFVFTIHGRLTKIETELSAALDMSDRVTSVESRLLVIELKEQAKQ